jgi:hypothetical protein
MYNLNDNFTELAGQIASNTAIITDYLKKIGLPEPNFTVDSAGALPPVPEIQIARLALIDATAKLQNLATGSDDFLWREATLVRDPSILGETKKLISILIIRTAAP